MEQGQECDYIGATAKIKQRGEQAKELWDKIKAAHSNAPWPNEPVVGNSEPDIIFVSDATPLHSQYEMGRYSVFITANGYMGIGPSFIDIDDVVFAIVGGEALYIGRSMADVLTKREPIVTESLSRINKKTQWAKNKDLHTFDLFKFRDFSEDKSLNSRIKAAPIYEKIEEKERERLVDELERITTRKGGAMTGWQLIGEAYVQGIMNGKIAVEMVTNVQRYDFV